MLLFGERDYKFVNRYVLVRTNSRTRSWTRKKDNVLGEWDPDSLCPSGKVKCFPPQSPPSLVCPRSNQGGGSVKTPRGTTSGATVYFKVWSYTNRYFTPLFFQHLFYFGGTFKLYNRLCRDILLLVILLPCL